VLAAPDIEIAAVSRFFRTPCFPPGAGPDFVNAAAVILTHLAPDVLLERLHAVEAELGRERNNRWEARVVDLDLLAMGDRVLPDTATLDHWITLPMARQTREAPDRLILPHPRLQDRGFVLVPLADVAPDWHHPTLGRSVTEMLEALPEGEIDGIVPL
jgi:2-amino-4-hydroxy-6-hydroxymethyldihydropteridine diphosphokinase